MSERRRWPRRTPGELDPWTHARTRSGRELRVVNASAGGVLVESATRLLPNTHLDVHVVTADGRLLVRSRVVRAWVSRLDVDGVRFLVALSFGNAVRLDGPGHIVPAPHPTPAPVTSTNYPHAATNLDGPAETGRIHGAEAAAVAGSELDISSPTPHMGADQW